VINKRTAKRITDKSSAKDKHENQQDVSEKSEKDRRRKYSLES
jgi:hypothetical protein